MTYTFKGTPTPQAAPCGTPGGYQTHHRRGTPPCTPCRDAQATYMREYRRRKGLTTSTLVPLKAECPNCGHHITQGAA